MCVRHVYQGAALDAAFVAHVEADIILDVESPYLFVFLQGEAEEVLECESVLVVGVDAEAVVD